MNTHHARTIRYAIGSLTLASILSACGAGTNPADESDASAQSNITDTANTVSALASELTSTSDSISTSDLTDAQIVSTGQPVRVPDLAAGSSDKPRSAAASPVATGVPEGEPLAVLQPTTDTGTAAVNPFEAITTGSSSDSEGLDSNVIDVITAPGLDQDNGQENTVETGSDSGSGDEVDNGGETDTESESETDADGVSAESEGQTDGREQAEADAQAEAEADAQRQAEADSQAEARAQAEAQEQAEAQAQAEAEAEAQTEAESSDTVIYNGELESGESLGPVECFVIDDTNQNFGDVSESDWQRWFENYTYSHGSENLATGQDSSRVYLRQRLIPASNGSSRVQAGRNLDSARTYRLTQSFYFEPGFDWGGSNEGGKVGFGVGGGTTPSGGQLQTDGFTLRLMWRGNKDGTARMVAYSYAADRSQSLPWGDNYALEGFEIPIGEWFDLTLEVKTNRTTSSRDGSLRAWVNDELLLQRDNIGWQTSGDRPAVQKLVFTTFYGGSDASWSPSTITYIRYADACWAPVRNPSGELLDDPLSVEDAQTPAVLLDDAVMTIRGQVIDSLSNMEILLPTEFMMINTEIFSALNDINSALANTRWPDNHSIPLGSAAIEELTRASETLSLLSANGEAVAYIQQQSETNAQALINAAYALTDRARLQVRDDLTTNSCSGKADANACSTAMYRLAQAEVMLDQSTQSGLDVGEKSRLINTAWEEVNAAAGQR